MRRAVHHALMSVGALLVLLTVLMALDERVRTQIWKGASASPSVELGFRAQQADHMAHVFFVAARSQGLAHAPLVMFALAAAVLTLFMLRT